jgi:predicted nucleic acid-binding protein
MYTLDANIFVRDLDTREPQHAECHALLDELQAQALPIVVPVLVLAEVAGTVSRTRHDPMAGRLAADLLRGIGNLTLIPIDDSLAQEAAELAADYALRGADATYVAVARRHNCTLVSLDREQRERSAAIVTTRTPAEALAELQPPRAAS